VLERINKRCILKNHLQLLVLRPQQSSIAIISSMHLYFDFQIYLKQESTLTTTESTARKQLQLIVCLSRVVHEIIIDTHGHMLTSFARDICSNL
jgi:hypothetical protein